MRKFNMLALSPLLVLLIPISILLVAVNSPAPAAATQTVTTCTITGYILKPDGITPLTGAVVKIVKAQKNGASVLFAVSPSTTTTDSAGKFTITAPRGPDSTIWINAPSQGFNLAAGKAVAVPDSSTATFTLLNAVVSPPAFLEVLVPTQVTILSAGSAYATGVNTVNFGSGFTLSTTEGRVNVSGSGTTDGTYTTTLATGYLVTGPANDGLFRSGTGLLSFPNSNLGIKATPQSTFDVAGSVAIGTYAGSTPAPSNGMIISGAVGIGTSSPNGQLDVNGAIYQRGSQLFADYVFEPGYHLESIEEHSRLMWAAGHLPAMSPRRVDENKREIVDVGSRTKQLLEELEKAHLYIQQLNERVKRLERRSRR